MKAIELIQKGEIHVFEEDGSYFLFSRLDNNLYDLTHNMYEYLNQELNNFISNKNNDEAIISSLNIRTKKINNDKVINLLTYRKDALVLATKNILDSYNSCNTIYLVIEVNHETINFIEEIIKWFNGYERIVIVCRVNIEENHFLSMLKTNLKMFSKITSLKFIIDTYQVLYNLNNNDLEYKSIKISPLLSSRILNDIEKKNVVDFILKTSVLKQYHKLFQSNLKIRPLEIMTVNDIESLKTTNDVYNNCNNCWAKNACFSNNMYKNFSYHPYSCSINVQNCDIIKETLMKIFVDSINNKKQHLKNKLSNKNIAFQNFSIIHLNNTLLNS